MIPPTRAPRRASRASSPRGAPVPPAAPRTCCRRSAAAEGLGGRAQRGAVGMIAHPLRVNTVADRPASAERRRPIPDAKGTALLVTACCDEQRQRMWQHRTIRAAASAPATRAGLGTPWMGPLADGHGRWHLPSARCLSQAAAQRPHTTTPRPTIFTSCRTTFSAKAAIPSAAATAALSAVDARQHLPRYLPPSAEPHPERSSRTAQGWWGAAPAALGWSLDASHSRCRCPLVHDE
jgi:hypothetical protein